MKPLVLGGSGFVGINLINALIDKNYKVTGTFFKKISAKFLHPS